DILKILTLRRGRRRLVEVHRNLISLPNLLPDMARHGDAVFDGQALDGDEWHHIRRPHTRVRALVLGQINQLRGLADPANNAFLYRFALAHQRDDAAVVIGVHLTIEQVHAIDLHGIDDGIDYGFITALRKVGNAFDQSWHK